MLFITYIRYVAYLAYLDLNHAHLEVSQFFSSNCLALMEIIFAPNCLFGHFAFKLLLLSCWVIPENFLFGQYLLE